MIQTSSAAIRRELLNIKLFFRTAVARDLAARVEVACPLLTPSASSYLLISKGLLALVVQNPFHCEITTIPREIRGL